MKKLLALALSLLLLPLALGSSAPAPKTKTIVLPITAVQWLPLEIALLEATGLNPEPGEGSGPTDSLYWMPTYAQLTELDKKVRPKLHLKYIPEARDCNHFAFEFYVLSHEWAIKNITQDAPISLAVFICYVRIHPEAFDGRFGGNGLHALALIFSADGVAWFYDVQSGYHVKVVEAVIEGSIEPLKIVW